METLFYILAILLISAIMISFIFIHENTSILLKLYKIQQSKIDYMDDVLKKNDLYKKSYEKTFIATEE